MKKNLFLNTFLFLILQIGFAKAQFSEGTDKFIASHPRLLLLTGEEKTLLKAVQKDRYKLKVHYEILRECDSILNTVPVERIKIGMRLLSKSREALLRIFYLSYAWRMTEDKKYFYRAEKELLAISAFSDWNPSHFLDVAEMTIAASIGYDWLYHELSPQSRTIIKAAIIEKGIKPSLDSKNNWWLKATHNWNQVCNAGMVFGGLAIFEDSSSLAKSVIERAQESIKLPMKDYEPDGAYPEGYMYWGYGTTFNVLMISALERAFGENLDLSGNKGFLATARYMQNMTGPSGDCFNFSDSDLGGVLQPAMFWFAQKANDPSLLWVEKDHTEQLSANVREDIRILPLTLIWSKGINLEDVKPPSNFMWAGKGKTPIVLMRSSWTDSNAVFLGFKGGSPSTNHSHMDIGSFIMEANGVRWALDLGRQDYQSLESKKINIWEFDQQSERWSVFRYNNFAHNTLTVNNQLQNVKGHASLLSFSKQKDFTNAIMDLSSIYPDLKKVVRGVGLVNNEVTVVKDEFEGGTHESVVKWSMLTAAEVTLISRTKALLTQNGKKMFLEVIGPKDIEVKTWSTKSPNSFDADNIGTIILGFEMKIKANQKKSTVVLLKPYPDLKLKKMKRLPLADWKSDK